MVDKVPKIEMLDEKNVREGSFEYEEFVALKEDLPEFLKGLVSFAYSSGRRFSEITGLTWPLVDMKQRFVRLEVGTTKNKEARSIWLDDELFEIFQHQSENATKEGFGSPFVFPNKKGDGPIKDIRGSWEKACKEAGITNRIFHDFRRTAARNMIKSGIPDKVIMKITGHKTRSVFDRYYITNEEDLKSAAQKHQEFKNSWWAQFRQTLNFLQKQRGWL